MRRIFWFILFPLLSSFVFEPVGGTDSTKMATLPDVMSPQSMHVDENRLYIADGHRILIYGLNDFGLRKIFGKKGDGEQEFRAHARGIRLLFDVQSDDIVINSYERVSFFSKDGEFKSVQQYPYPQTDFVIPMGRQYIAAYYYIHVGTGKSSKHILIFDDNLQFVKKITEGTLGSGSAKGFGGPDRKLHVDLVPRFYGFRAYEDKIYIGNSYDGFFIEVYDSTGEKLYDIKRDFEKLKVDEAFKQKRMKEIKDRWQRYIDSIAIDEVEFFPAFRNFTVSDGKIYVYTYQEKEGNQEIVMLDLKGNHLKNVFVPRADHSKIMNGKYYFLHQNEDEEWEVHGFEVG